MRSVRPSHVGVLVAAAVLVTLTACGGGDEPGTASTSGAASTQVETTATETPSEIQSEDPTEGEPTEDGADVEIEVTIAGDTVTTAADRVPVEVGQTVHITVTGDADDEIHVHGFEIEQAMVADTPAEIEFVVGTSPGPGLYEVETHESALLLFQLEVR